MSRKEHIVQALKLTYEGRKETALVNLTNYFDNAVGVGEHPGVVQECAKLLEEIDHCEHMIERLAKW